MSCLGTDLVVDTLAFADAVEASFTVAPTVTTSVTQITGSIRDSVTDLNPFATVPDISEFTATPVFPAPPEDLVVGSVPVPSLPPEPTFSSAAPILETLTPPNLFTDSPPNAPVIDAVAVVDEPTITIPEAPNLSAISIPEISDLVFPELDAVMSLAPMTPVASMDWSESDYTSDLISVLEARLLEFLSGLASALPAKTEAAVWERRRDELLRDSQDAIQVGSAAFSGRGAVGVDGSLLRILYEEFESSVFDASNSSREIMQKQAQLEQDNFVAAVEFGVMEQTNLMDLHNQSRERALEALITVANAKIDLYNSISRLYQIDAQVFAAQASAFSEKIKAEISKVEVVKARLDGLNARNQLNESEVRVYVAQLKGVEAEVDVFKSRVAAGRNRILNNVNRAEGFRAEVDGVTATIKGKKAQVDGYSESIQAEILRLQAYSSQVDAYRAQTDVFKTLVDAKVDIQLADFNQKQKIPLEVYRTKLEVFKEQVSAETIRIEALTKRQAAELDLYSTEEKAKTAKVSSSVGIGKAASDASIASSSAGVDIADAQQRISIANRSLAAASSRATQQVVAMADIGNISANTTNISTSKSDNTTSGTHDSFNTSVSTSCSKVGTTNSVATISNVNITEGTGPGFFANGPTGAGGCF